MTTTRLHTADELLAMGEDAPYILIEGTLVEEMPSGNTSSEVGLAIGSELRAFVRPRRLGRAHGADGGFILQRNPDTVVAPDAAFIRAERLPPPEEMGNGFVPTYADLAVEVLSPSDRPGETARKVALYRKAGVPLVWVIDPERETATVHMQGREPVTIGRGARLDGADVLPGFALPLDELLS